MKKNNRIEINLGGGLKLVAERNSNSNYDREIYIGLEHNGAWMQDLALVRPDEHTADSFNVLVWGDADDEDYTNYFEIKRFIPDEE